ncbi:branched-chain amino acid ABC transporter permease [Dulcicalothrix desertica PCC 7102]|uniref:Branched-chain amino acid ABC transporter permease n=1 Tax=Dulcicalothrix desertica PCC 7102 TaxID=232991 RepID=A0A3S1C8X1_9CYAN|nr:branched-chain amino acid ABC transporter permease [Dulcicalothrix desertica]RUS97383.1 branched-chain amino acid ABC transporter permease [Dulcicalothrix desertica PCC 7102]TWH55561.1 branched-chain amino acid transport system permease protein [Dulcicalothrix desertica PCC 7102]
MIKSLQKASKSSSLGKKSLSGWQKILLYIVIAYLVLLLAPIAGFDLPRIIGEIKSNPALLVQQLLIGLVNGAIIAIIALGYTMVYGIIELINFAHGDLYMLGAFASLTVIGAFGITDGTSFQASIGAIIIALIVSCALCASLNILTEKYAYRPLRNAPRLAPLISAIGVSFIFQNTGLFWGGLKSFIPVMGVNAAAPKNFPDLLPRIDIFKALGIETTIQFTTKDLIVLVTALVLMVGLHSFVQFTSWGKAMRATAQNRDAAKMMGINVDGIIILTFLIGGCLAGAAGLLVGLYNNTIVFTMGFTAGLRAFTAAVLGGIGNIVGAMLGGLLIGLLSAISDQYFSSRWTNAWVFAVLVIILALRPGGLLGDSAQEKV